MRETAWRVVRAAWFELRFTPRGFGWLLDSLVYAPLAFVALSVAGSLF